MKIIYISLIILTTLPYLGLYTFNIGNEAQMYGNTDAIILPYTIYIIIYLLITFLIMSVKNTKIKNGIKITGKELNILQIKCFIAISLLLIINLLAGGYEILNQEIDRGTFRANVDTIGMVYNLVTTFLPSSLLAVTVCAYLHHDGNKNKSTRSLQYLVILLAMLCGITTGFKSTALFIILPALFIYSEKLELKSILIISIVIFIGMAISTAYFMKYPLDGIAKYLFTRSTAIAVSGSVSVWHHFPNGGEDSSYTLLYSLGNNLSSLITGIAKNTPEFLKINLTRYIAYIADPRYDEALSGAFNLTVTNFGEGVYFFGRDYVYIYSIISAAITGIVLLKFKRHTGNSMLWQVTTAVYIAHVLFPWLLNSMIGNLFGIPTIFNMVVSILAIIAVSKI
ncbi:hypothetical protein [Aquitalea sp. FJL05]|uniref:hypothetical protein n=1 Tax=Aquitalea sp. FJL05 TaxID=2153366 RepID=UPI000F59D9AD|nr:hypothetical protein [Aquitalea sp. FJL05]